MADILRWSTLACTCGGTQFYQVYTVRRHPTGGLTRELAGERCSACDALLDVATLTRQAQLEKKRQELAALEAELDTESGPATPPPLPMAVASRPR